MISIYNKIRIKIFGWIGLLLINKFGLQIDECVRDILYVNKGSVESHIVSDKKLIKYFNYYYQGERVAYFNNYVALGAEVAVRASEYKDFNSGIVLFLGPKCEKSLNEAVSLIWRVYDKFNFKTLKIRPHPRYKFISEQLVIKLNSSIISKNIEILLVDNGEINYQIRNIDYVLGYYSSLIMMIHHLSWSKVVVDHKYCKSFGQENMDYILDLMAGKRMLYINELDDIFCVYDPLDDCHNSSIIPNKFIDVVGFEIEKIKFN